MNPSQQAKTGESAMTKYVSDFVKKQQHLEYKYKHRARMFWDSSRLGTYRKGMK